MENYWFINKHDIHTWFHLVNNSKYFICQFNVLICQSDSGNPYIYLLRQSSFKLGPYLWFRGPISSNRWFWYITSTKGEHQQCCVCTIQFTRIFFFFFFFFFLNIMSFTESLLWSIPPVGSGAPAFRLGIRIDPHRHRGVVKVHWRVLWVGGLFFWVVATFTL